MTGVTEKFARLWCRQELLGPVPTDATNTSYHEYSLQCDAFKVNDSLELTALHPLNFDLSFCVSAVPESRVPEITFPESHIAISKVF